MIKTSAINTPQIPLDVYSKPNLFKLMMFDIGLLNSQLDVEFNTVLSQTQESYKGFIAENAVLQQLQSGTTKDYYTWANGNSNYHISAPIYMAALRGGRE